MTVDRVPSERMAACRRTVVSVGESLPNAYLATYLAGRYTLFEHNLLARLAVSAAVDGRSIDTTDATDIVVEDEPGHVTAQFSLGSVRIDARITPLLVGEEDRFEGAACYEVRSSPPTALSISITTGTIYFDSLSVLRGGGLPPPEWAAEMLGPQQAQVAPHPPADPERKGDAVWFRGSEDAFAIAVATRGEVDLTAGLAVLLAEGSGRVVVAFADEPDRAVALAGTDVASALAAVDEHYDRLLANRIETPDAAIDAAFRTAIYNLEYTWTPPFGWVECVHHWSALWHMQHTSAAEWLGQIERSRRCTLEHAARLLPGGRAPNSAVHDVGVPTRLGSDDRLPGAAVPQLTPGGHAHLDFGGSDQFWAAQVAHHWRFTGDVEFAARIVDRFDDVLAHTIASSDADADGLWSWGFQIGNQEDYVTTPGAGATPTVEGIAMLTTRAELAEALGDRAGASEWRFRAATMRARLGERLWLADLGRFAYFAEPGGPLRLDGQYHTYLYPVIHGLLDPLASYTSVRHVADRLTGAAGEVYCSNNFPSHPGGTWGMQAGAAQQPWAARGLAAVGRWNDVVAPLRAVASWVLDANHRGSWPEVASEPTPAYFSPPAGLFVSAVCEALFGLDIDRPRSRVTIAPAFPDDWPSARLTSGGVVAEYERVGNRREYTLTTPDPIRRTLRWALPPGGPRSVLVNGRPVRGRIEPGVGHVVLVVDARASRTTRFTVEWEAAPISIDHRGWTAEGGEVVVSTDGLIVEGIEDPCAVTDRVEVMPGRVVLGVRARLLVPYAGFGPLGQQLFSRRTVFLRCRLDDQPGGGTVFHLPVDLTIVPPVETAVQEVVGDGRTLRLTVRNNTDARLRADGRLQAGTDTSGARRGSTIVAIDVPARSERHFSVTAPPGLLPGANSATLTLPAVRGERRAGVDLDVGLTVRRARIGGRRSPRSRAIPVTLQLPSDSLVGDHDFTSWRRMPAHHHPPWWNAKSPLEELTGCDRLEMPGLAGVPFHLEDGRVVPVGFAVGRARLELALPSAPVAKVSCLVVPFLDNHDMFAVVGRAALLGGGAVVTTRDLYFPGDLDWWYTSSAVGEFATAVTDRQGGLPLLPQLGHDDDWPDARPPMFPSPRLWSRAPALVTSGAVICAVEIVPPEPLSAESFVLETVGELPAFGVVAATALTVPSRHTPPTKERP